MENQIESKISEQTIWKDLDWYPSKHQIEQLEALQNLLRKWNKLVNLTKLVEGNQFWISQVIDSLWPIKNELKDPEQKLNIIDVGTGCGFPGLAIAISLPQSSITLVDSINKKTNALHNIVEMLGLSPRVNILTERIEITGQNKLFRGSFDLATARAVAKAPVLAEYLIPLLNQQGQAIIYKGKWSDVEQKHLIRSLTKLYAKIDLVETFALPNELGERSVIRISKKSSCPNKYPRSVGKAIKCPLGSQSDDNL